VAYGTFGSIKVACSPHYKAGECDHPTYDVTEVLLFNEGLTLETLAEHFEVDEETMQMKADRAVKQGFATVAEGKLFPTILGTWWEDVSFN
jgi:hypothetical protein